jgi:DNA mismatch endonuclease (patch repair protein)
MTSDAYVLEPPTAAVRRVMQGNRGTDTSPERQVRSALHRYGLRFRKRLTLHINGRRTTPDIVFPRHHVCVYVDGCFWHGCPTHGRRPRRNQAYWTAKFERNIQRDREITSLLSADGWTVVRAWEHEPVELTVRRVIEALGGDRLDRSLATAS